MFSLFGRVILLLCFSLFLPPASSFASCIVFFARFLLSLCFHLLLLLLFHLLLHLHFANSCSLLMFHLKNSLFIISSCLVSTISYQPTRSPCFYHQVPGMAAMASRVRIQQKGHPEMAVESVPNSTLLSAQTWCLVLGLGYACSWATKSEKNPLSSLVLFVFGLFFPIRDGFSSKRYFNSFKVSNSDQGPWLLAVYWGRMKSQLYGL